MIHNNVILQVIETEVEVVKIEPVSEPVIPSAPVEESEVE